MPDEEIYQEPADPTPPEAVPEPEPVEQPPQYMTRDEFRAEMQGFMGQMQPQQAPAPEDDDPYGDGGYTKGIIGEAQNAMFAQLQPLLQPIMDQNAMLQVTQGLNEQESAWVRDQVGQMGPGVAQAIVNTPGLAAVFQRAARNGAPLPAPTAPRAAPGPQAPANSNPMQDAAFAQMKAQFQHLPGYSDEGLRAALTTKQLP